MPLTAAEKRLAAAIGFDQEVCLLVKQHAGQSFNRVTGYTEEYKEENANGLSVAVERQEDVESLISRLQPELLSRGYRAFWSALHEPDGRKRSEAIVVLKSTDQCEILRLKRSAGGNHDVSADDVLQRLSSWRNRCDFEVVGADGSWVAIRFNTLPENICDFAEEIYDFCPDTVEQGVGLLNENDAPEKFDAARRLCPTLSPRMQKKMDAQRARIEGMKTQPRFRAFFESGSFGFTTSTDMGIRLLAYELKRTKCLFLWWD